MVAPTKIQNIESSMTPIHKYSLLTKLMIELNNLINFSSWNFNIALSEPGGSGRFSAPFGSGSVCSVLSIQG